MTDMKTTFLGLLLLTATAISAQEQARTFQLADAPRYSEETGYGYDLAPTPEKGSKAPFFFSVRVPDGNYNTSREGVLILLQPKGSAWKYTTKVLASDILLLASRMMLVAMNFGIHTSRDVLLLKQSLR